MEKMPEKTNLELQAEDSFINLEIKSEEQLDDLINKIFTEVCGDSGREEFFNITLPAVKKVYGSNYRKAGLRLLEIIDEGSALKKEQIADFFKTSISKKEIDFSAEDKREILNQICEKVRDLIKKQKEEYGEEYKGVVAAIIYGGYAKLTMREDSDIDILYITETDNKGDFMKKDERFLYYAEDFTKKLEKTTRKLIDNASAVFIGNHEALRDLIYSESGIIRGQYVIVAADEKIETEIRDILKNEDV